MEQITNEEFLKSCDTNLVKEEELILSLLQYELLFNERVFVSELKKQGKNYLLNQKHTISTTDLPNSKFLANVLGDDYYLLKK